MRKQILAVMVGLSVVLAGCSTQSTESMLQEVKKDTKEVKSGKVTMMMASTDKDNRTIGFNVSGDEKFDPLEFKVSGEYLMPVDNIEVERYLKDDIEYTKVYTKSIIRPFWTKNNIPKDKKHELNFKTESLNTKDGILNLLDNKDNWDITKDGDKVIFKLKINEELKNKVKKELFSEGDEEIKFSEFNYTIEYVYNTKTKYVEKLVYELNTKTEDLTISRTIKGSLEEINKEVKIEVPEESKNTVEFKGEK